MVPLYFISLFPFPSFPVARMAAGKEMIWAKPDAEDVWPRPKDLWAKVSGATPTSQRSPDSLRPPPVFPGLPLGLDRKGPGKARIGRSG